MEEKYVITISHQLGCGGAEIGKKLAEQISIPFIDRQILKMVADYLTIPEEEIESREERMSSFWQNFARLESFSDPIMSMGAQYIPTDKELFALESEFIEQIVAQKSVVILGRGGHYILRSHPRRFSVFIHADLSDRIKRVSRLYQATDTEAKKIIERNDRERNTYLKSFTKSEWLDARAYDICLNTSSIGIDASLEIIKSGLRNKLGLTL